MKRRRIEGRKKGRREREKEHGNIMLHLDLVQIVLYWVVDREDKREQKEFAFW